MARRIRDVLGPADDIWVNTIQIGSTTISETELAVLDASTPGTVTASLGVVVDANKDISGFRHVTQIGPAGTGTASASILGLQTAETTVVDGDQLGRIDFKAPSEASGTDAILTAAFIAAEADDTFTASVNDCDIVFGMGISEAATTKFRMSSAGHFHPETNDGGALGISGTAWADLFLASGGVVNFNAGNYTITHTAGVLTFSGSVTPTGGVAAAGGFSASPRSIHTGSYPAIASTSGNDSTPSTTETYVSEIFVPCNMTITGVALFNGSNVTGNVTVGLANSAGAPIAAAKSASTAGSGTDAYQRIPFAVAYAAVGPAFYYLQVQYDSATARYNTHTVGNHGVLVQTSQSYGTFASFTPPTTFVTNVGNMASLY